MDFRKAKILDNKIKSTKKRENTKYKLLYIRDNWYIRYKGKNIEVEMPTLVGCTKLYSLPNNDKGEEWTESRILSPISEERANIIKNIWSKYKPGDKVEIQFTKCKIIK